MKKWIVLISVLAGCLYMVACGSETATAPERVPTKAPAVVIEKEPQAQEIVNEVTLTPTPTEVPQSPVYDFTINLFGEELSFPMWYGEMVRNGWDDFYDEDWNLEPGKAGIYMVGNKDTDAYGIFYNCTDNTQPFFSCAIAGLRLDEALIAENGIEATLPGNIVLGAATENDIIAAYGEPTSSQDGMLRYELAANRYVKLNVTDGILKEIELCNVETLGERPLKYAYEASEETVFSYQVQVGGVEYKLPFAYDELKANGWEPEDDPNTVLGSDRGGWGSWVKDGFRLFTMYYNTDDTDICLCESMIYGVKATDTESIPMFQEYPGIFVLPGEISLMESVWVDVLLAYGEPTDENSDNYYLVYESGETGRVRIYYDREKPMTITGISIEYMPFMEGRSAGTEAVPAEG